ncbi:hypothetical protein KP806_07415 [Paenibacillus sp. N4]|uniref:hypothetical protein n=1 Tax=Paenibacillus vietnamensis TaxID=2590547 RepID=UPI001CD0466D|nr:hypothetical protein [Paenibacillus vietnamensis]MCA0754874.1 hypothetical protein [Paenibacillus vietnamensis]
MSKALIIQSVTVISAAPMTFSVGDLHKGREIIEIKQLGYDSISEFHVLDEEGDLIVSIENCPAVIEWKPIVTDGPPPCGL